jgi:hypothetical protein
VVILVIVSVYGIVWQIDLLIKRREFSRLRASTVGKVISKQEAVDVEYRGFTPTKYYVNYIEVRFKIDAKDLHLRAAVKKSVYDNLLVDAPVEIYYSIQNPRIVLLETELKKS